jgi:hypothetical protein
MMMNVYNRATTWGTFATLVLFAGMLVLDIWLMNELPILRHGLAYAMLQIAMVALLLKFLRLVFRGGSPSSKE